MTDITQLILQQAGLKSSPFSPGSRYNGIPTSTIVNSSGEQVFFLKRRLLPDPDDFFEIQRYIVNENDRLDNVANRFYGDPEKFWQLCDANNTMHPHDLAEEPGSAIKITLPEGIPGNKND